VQVEWGVLTKQDKFGEKESLISVLDDWVEAGFIKPNQQNRE
jgi:hypothetical protein